MTTPTLPSLGTPTETLVLHQDTRPAYTHPVPSAPTGRLRTTTFVLSTAFRDTTIYPNAHTFALRLAEPLRNVFALRLLRAEFSTASTSPAFVVLNQYKRIVLADGNASAFFAMVAPGVELYPIGTTSVEHDPYVFIFRPPEDRLVHFDVRVCDQNMGAYATAGFQLVLTLTAYCMEGIL